MNELKEQLKKQSQELREKKTQTKKAQRNYSLEYRSGGYSSDDWIRNPQKWRSIQPLYNEMLGLQFQLLDDKRACRIDHIVYSMMRGRSIHQIEKTVKDKNIAQDIYRTVKNILEKSGKEWIE